MIRRLVGPALVAAGMSWSALALGQGATGTNPPVGSVWTYLGATYGAGWQPPAAFQTTTASCPSIVAFGGVGDGNTDNGPAMTATINAQPQGYACVFFPAGKFKFANPYSFTYPSTSLASLALRGAGANVTQLIGPNNGSLFTFTFSQQFDSIHVADLSLITTNPCSTCTALSLVMSPATTASGYSGQSDFTGVNITGSDLSPNIPSGSNYWLTGIDDFGVSNINFYGVYIEGIQNSSGPTPGTSRGVYIHGDAAHVPVQFNFTASNIVLYNRALDVGPYTQGVTWVNGNMTGNMVGVYVSSLPGQQAAQLSIANSAANSCSNVFVPSTTAGASSIGYVVITNNVLLTNGQPWPCGSFTTNLAMGFDANYVIISDNVLSGTAAFTGVDINGPSYVAGKVVHNMFNGFGTAVDTTAYPTAVDNSGALIDGNTITNGNIGIKIGPLTHDAVVSNNVMQGNTTDLVDNSGSTNANMVDIPRTCQPAMIFGFGQITLTSQTWSGGQVTFVTSSPHGVNVGDTFVIISSLPGGYTGSFTAIAGTTGSTLVASLATNPGTSTALGYLFGATNTTYSSTSCVVSIVNREVFLDFDYTFSNLGTSTGTMLAQLPNQSAPTAPGAGSALTYASNMTGVTGAVSASLAPNASQLTFAQWSATGMAALTKANLTNTARLAGRVVFRAPTFQPSPPP